MLLQRASQCGTRWAAWAADTLNLGSLGKGDVGGQMGAQLGPWEMAPMSCWPLGPCPAGTARLTALGASPHTTGLRKEGPSPGRLTPVPSPGALQGTSTVIAPLRGQPAAQEAAGLARGHTARAAKAHPRAMVPPSLVPPGASYRGVRPVGVVEAEAFGCLLGLFGVNDGCGEGGRARG